MKNSKLNMFVMTLSVVGTLFNSASYGSYPIAALEDLDDRIEQEKPSKPVKIKALKGIKEESRIKSSGPSFWTKAFIFGLLASSVILPVSAQQVQVPYIEPYRESNFTHWVSKNYEVDMPQSGLITPQYSYITTPTSAYPTGSGSSGYSIAGMLDSACVTIQKKIQRAWEIRRYSNQMYEDAQKPSVPVSERYSMVESAMNIELSSHVLELQALESNMRLSEVTSSIGNPQKKGCAIPTPKDQNLIVGRR